MFIIYDLAHSSLVPELLYHTLIIPSIHFYSFLKIFCSSRNSLPQAGQNDASTRSNCPSGGGNFDECSRQPQISHVIMVLFPYFLILFVAYLSPASPTSTLLFWFSSLCLLADAIRSPQFLQYIPIDFLVSLTVCSLLPHLGHTSGKVLCAIMLPIKPLYCPCRQHACHLPYRLRHIHAVRTHPA